MKVSVLDYGAGNVRSLLNALAAVGCEVEMIETAQQISAARVLIFPGVGSFGKCMEVLQKRGWVDALKAYVRADKPYLGICLGMQTLFEASERGASRPRPAAGQHRALRERRRPSGSADRLEHAAAAAAVFAARGRLADRRRLLCALVPRRAHQGARAVGADRNRLRRAVHLERAARPGDGVPIPPREIGRGRPQDAPQLCDVRAIGQPVSTAAAAQIAAQRSDALLQAYHRLHGRARERSGRPRMHKGRSVRCAREEG